MLIIGYVFAIRSERQFCREVQVNLAYRWFCELGLEDAIPDHSAFSRARNERFRESEVFRRVFERVVGACIVCLYWISVFEIDGIRFDNTTNYYVAGSILGLPGLDPAAASRAVKEYLATLNDAAFGAATEVQPKFVSPSDPAAQWTGALKGPAFFAYADNYLIDVQCGVIVDVEASRAIRQAEVGAARTMLERTEERFGLKPQRLADLLGSIEFYVNATGRQNFSMTLEHLRLDATEVVLKRHVAPVVALVPPCRPRPH
jgi:hypothetical protein